MPDPSQIDPRWKKKELPVGAKQKGIFGDDDTPTEFLGGFRGPQKQDYTQEIIDLTERVKSLENLIKSIFDGHVLINGQFRKITP